MALLMAVGRVMRPYGTRGEMRVHPLTDRPRERFGRLQSCVVWDPAVDRRDARRLRTVRFDGDSVLLGLEGVDSPEAVGALVGRLIAVPRAEALPVPAGQFYPWELEGAPVMTREGRVLGIFAGLETGPAHDLWVVRTGGREWLLPAVPEIVIEVSVAERRIVIDPPDGLTDL